LQELKNGRERSGETSKEKGEWRRGRQREKALLPLGARFYHQGRKLDGDSRMIGRGTETKRGGTNGFTFEMSSPILAMETKERLEKTEWRVGRPLYPKIKKGPKREKRVRTSTSLRDHLEA